PKRNGGWQREGRSVKGCRSQKYFVRPVDGKRKGYWGRIKDGVTGSGPDVYVVAAADSRTLHNSFPEHNRWSNWDSLGGPFESDSDQRDISLDLPWQARHPGKVYNFRTRRYENVNKRASDHYWSHAVWPRHGHEHRDGLHHLPVSTRDIDGTW
ncbi:uncharacterized protein K489DRAFT_307435, partial [Dissoconium aciculare CBS 342.82]|uniref:Uncharacterized protein n=1 Tax=Dissoconium aciculare CBS 342.82 TaxID=1314786 RepID=A0A6J3LYZ7_9PEZI